MTTEVGKLLVKIDAETAGVRKGLADVRKQVQSTTDRLGSLAVKLGAVYGTVQGARGFFAANSKFEDLALSLETVLGGAEEAKAGLGFIKEFAKTTPFEVDTLTKAVTQLSAQGIKPSADLLTIFGDASATTSDKLRTFEALVTMTTRSVGGGLGLEELNIIIDAGVPALAIFQEKLGLTRAQLGEFGATAEGATILVDTLKEGLKERFGGGMAKAAQSLSTTFSNLGEQFVEVMLALGDGIGGTGLNSAMKNFGDVATKLLVILTPVAKLIGSVLGTAFNAVIIPIGFVLDAFTATYKVLALLTGWIRDTFRPVFEPLATVFVDVGRSVTEGFTNAVKFAFNAFLSFYTGVLDFLRKIGNATGLESITDLANRFRDLRFKVDDTTEELRKNEEIMGRNIKPLEAIVEKNQDLIDSFQTMDNTLLKLQLRANGFGEELIDALDSSGLLEGKSLADFLLPTDELQGIMDRFNSMILATKTLSDQLEQEKDAAEELERAIDGMASSGESFAKGLDTVENHLERLEDQQNAVNVAFKTGKISAGQYQKAIETIHDELRQLDPIQKAMTETIDSAVGSAASNFEEMLSGMKSFSEGFKDIFQEIVAEIIRQIMKLYVISPIINAVMGFITSRFGGGFGLNSQAPAPIVDRSFASGGTVQARRPIMVGERGAELFVPNTGGKIMNNHQTNSAMKGGEITVNQNLNFTTGIQNTVRAEVLNMLPDIVEASKSGVLDAVQRGGAFKRAFA